jgi:hypothetical protein
LLVSAIQKDSRRLGLRDAGKKHGKDEGKHFIRIENST